MYIYYIVHWGINPPEKHHRPLSKLFLKYFGSCKNFMSSANLVAEIH